MHRKTFHVEFSLICSRWGRVNTLGWCLLRGIGFEYFYFFFGAYSYNFSFLQVYWDGLGVIQNKLVNKMLMCDEEYINIRQSEKLAGG